MLEVNQMFRSSCSDAFMKTGAPSSLPKSKENIYLGVSFLLLGAAVLKPTLSNQEESYRMPWIGGQKRNFAEGLFAEHIWIAASKNL